MAAPQCRYFWVIAIYIYTQVFGYIYIYVSSLVLRNIVSFRSFDKYWISLHILLTTGICKMWKQNLMQFTIFHHVTCSCKLTLYDNTLRPNIMLCDSGDTTTLHCAYYVMLHYSCYITLRYYGIWYLKTSFYPSICYRVSCF